MKRVETLNKLLDDLSAEGEISAENLAWARKEVRRIEKEEEKNKEERDRLYSKPLIRRRAGSEVVLQKQ